MEMGLYLYCEIGLVIKLIRKIVVNIEGFIVITIRFSQKAFMVIFFIVICTHAIFRKYSFYYVFNNKSKQYIKLIQT